MNGRSFNCRIGRIPVRSIFKLLQVRNVRCGGVAYKLVVTRPAKLLTRLHSICCSITMCEQRTTYKKMGSVGKCFSKSQNCELTLCYAMLCYAMLCYAMLCYAMLCYAMLCYAMLCYAMLCYAMLCYAMLRYATLRYATLCYAMLCYAMLCYAMLCYAMLCYAMLC